MKKIILFFICLSSFTKVNASHLFGGEITWQCITSGTDIGKYIFTLKIYRDCQGIPFTPATSIRVYSTDAVAANYPSTWSIALNTGTSTDISPSFCPNNCNMPGLGTIQEFVQTSPPTVLTGIPPTTGWVFEYDDCCRNSLVNTTGSGFTVRSIMYPFNNQNTNPCFDSSPFFAERPQLFSCIGYPHKYNPFVTDVELDSLHYSFAQCLEQPTTNPPAPFAAPSIPYTAPYTTNIPFPGNPTLNPLSGEMTFNPNLSGNFAFTVKTESYKCGIKVAEIYRDVAFTLTSGCTLPSSGNVNTPPNISAPFVDPLTGLYTLYSDTVFAGDTVNFTFGAFDSEIGTSAGGSLFPQSVTLESVASQYGTGYTDPAGGCLLPPCATLSTPLPHTSSIASSTQFNWVTDPIHLGLQYGCAYLPNTYYFLLKASDDYCPAHAISYATASITVLPTIPAPIVNNNGGNLSTSVVSGFSYQWYRNRFLIPGATSASYTPINNGFYQVRIMDANFNGNYSAGFNVNTGINDPFEEYNVIVFPNPVKDIITLQLNNKNIRTLSYSLNDFTGRVILNEQVNTLPYIIQKQINVSSLAKGIYNLQVKVNGSIMNKKVILDR